MNKIQLPKKVIRDLDKYKELIDKALDGFGGKYFDFPARTLHEMLDFYYLLRYTETIESFKLAYKYAVNLNRTEDFTIPGSSDEFFLKKLKLND